MGDLTLPLGDLPAQAEATRNRLDELIAQNPEHGEMLRQLEAAGPVRTAADHGPSATSRRATSWWPSSRSTCATSATTGAPLLPGDLDRPVKAG